MRKFWIPIGKSTKKAACTSPENGTASVKLTGLQKIGKKHLPIPTALFLELLQLPTLPNSNWTEDLPISTSIAEFLSNRITILERGFNPVPQKEILETIVDLVRNYEGYLERSIPALRSQSSVVELAKKSKRNFTKPE